MDNDQQWDLPAASSLHPDFGDAGRTPIAAALRTAALGGTVSIIKTALEAQLPASRL